MWWRDRATIEQRHAAAHAGPYRETVLKGALRSLEALAPDLALAHVDWRLSGQSPAPGAGEAEDAGRTGQARARLARGVMTFVLQRGPEGWRIRAAQNTEKR